MEDPRCTCGHGWRYHLLGPPFACGYSVLKPREGACDCLAFTRRDALAPGEAPPTRACLALCTRDAGHEGPCAAYEPVDADLDAALHGLVRHGPLAGRYVCVVCGTRGRHVCEGT